MKKLLFMSVCVAATIAVCTSCQSEKIVNRQYPTVDVDFGSIKSYPDSISDHANAILFSGCEPNWECGLIGESSDRLYVELSRPDDDFSITTWVNKSAFSVDTVVELEYERVKPRYHFVDGKQMPGIEAIMTKQLRVLVYADSVSASFSAALSNIPWMSLFWGGRIIDKSENRLKMELMQDLAQPGSTESLITGWVEKGMPVVFPPKNGADSKAGPNLFILYQKPTVHSGNQRYVRNYINKKELLILDYAIDENGEKWLKVKFFYLNPLDATPVVGWINQWSANLQDGVD
ncbi:MAG: hypothetical protein K2M07_01825 [Muribaculaceae bacterium]|nr:hypothetical protein [Muribaculaceae bacterium]